MLVTIFITAIKLWAVITSWVTCLKWCITFFRHGFHCLSQIFCWWIRLSEYHTGYRAYSRKVLTNLNFSRYSNDYVFDNELLAGVLYKGFEVGEISCPAKYFPEASSINFSWSIKYGWGVLATSVKYRLNKMGVMRSKIFDWMGKTLLQLFNRSKK